MSLTGVQRHWSHGRSGLQQGLGPTWQQRAACPCFSAGARGWGRPTRLHQRAETRPESRLAAELSRGCCEAPTALLLLLAQFPRGSWRRVGEASPWAPEAPGRAEEGMDGGQLTSQSRSQSQRIKAKAFSAGRLSPPARERATVILLPRRPGKESSVRCRGCY